MHAIFRFVFVLFPFFVDEMVTQNTEQCQNVSALSSGERLQFEYQSDESHLHHDSEFDALAHLTLEKKINLISAIEFYVSSCLLFIDQLVLAAKDDVTETALFLFPKYPEIFGSSLNTSSVFNYRSPHTNEVHSTDTSTVEMHRKLAHE